MDNRRLGESDLELSAVGIGCNNFGMRIDEAQTKRVVDAAIDHGITLFDTADIYGRDGTSETFLGNALGAKRSKIILATKFGMPLTDDPKAGGASRAYIMSAVENSLRRLKTDVIDLYQVHRADPNTPIEETIQALDDLVQAGKVRYVGISNFPAWMMADAQHTARHLNATPISCTQSHYSVINRQIEEEVIPAARRFGMGLLPYFPLESGLLSGKYRFDQPPPEGTRWNLWQARAPQMAQKFWSEAQFETAAKLEGIAKKFDLTLLELAFSWLLSRPIVSSVIAGATSAEQVAANVAAGSHAMPEELSAEIDALTKPSGR